MTVPLGAFVYLAAAIKEVVSIPVFCVGRINDPALAEKILADHQADMIGMVRATICDPEMPNKAREGRLDEIRRCIGCMEGCLSKYLLPVTCTYHPETGREKEFTITPAVNKKRVMVIGGGAAGLETARVAALRGHKVDLYDKEDVLAKELTIAAKSPGRESWEDPIRYYTHQMKLLGVDVHLGVTVTPEMVIKENADAVVIATGAVPYIPDIPGADGSNVVEMRQVLQGEVEVGQNVVVADYQSHIYGLDVAVFLAERGKKVELLAEDIPPGTRADALTLWEMYGRALSKGVVMTPLTKVREIKGNTVVTYNVLTGVEKEIEGVDTVVFTTNGMANDSLYRSLKGRVKELYEVGQCVSPRKMVDSVYDGAVVGRKI
jgi:thioredoxin reductase